MDSVTVERLRSILGDSAVMIDEASRKYYSTDLSFEPAEVAAVVIRPETTASLAEAVAFCQFIDLYSRFLHTSQREMYYFYKTIKQFFNS